MSRCLLWVFAALCGACDAPLRIDVPVAARDTGPPGDAGPSRVRDVGEARDADLPDATPSVDVGGQVTPRDAGHPGDAGQAGDAGQPVIPVSPSFVDVTVAAGLAIELGELRARPNCLLDYVYGPGPGDYCLPERYIGAAAVGDYDGDGWPDLYIGRVGGPGLLLRNQGDGTFADMTVASGLMGTAVISGAAWLDIEGDGDLDLMLTSTGALRNFLYVSNGAGQFDERAVERGVDVTSATGHVGTCIAVGDYDLDGYLDLFVGDWHPTGPLGFTTDLNRLLRNRGASAPGFFEDVTVQAGVDLDDDLTTPGIPGGTFTFAPAFVDLDGDRYPELAIASDYGTSRLYWNDAGSRFQDGARASGVASDAHGMGSAFGDYDGDGDLDWFVSGIYSPPGATGNRLFRNEGGRRFVDVTDALGVRAAGWGWGAAFFDANQDGQLDLALTGGWPTSTFDDEPLRLWLGAGSSPWPERAAESGVVFRAGGRGLVPFDYDRDGDLDLLVISNTTRPALFRNDDPPGAWLVVRVGGEAGNPRGVGVQVRLQVTAGGPWQVRHIGVGSQLYGQEDTLAHFGLAAGDAPVHRVEAYWPATDTRVVLEGVPRNQALVVSPSTSP